MNILALTFEAFRKEMVCRYGRDQYVAADIYRQIFTHGKPGLGTSRNGSVTASLIEALARDIQIPPWKVTAEHREEGLLKFVTQLEDGVEIESVVIPMVTHVTICVSSQVGCKMGCRFCETAALGFKRNLTVAEITGQVYTAKMRYGFSIRNIVFMGMGEPLDNFDHVTDAIRVLTDPRGFNIAMGRITLSTAGLPDGIEKLGRLGWASLHLALSLNASNDQIRSSIMPINRVHSMETVKNALLSYPLARDHAFYIEYVILKGVNDSWENANELVDFLSPLPVWFNLILYNKGSERGFEQTTDADVSRFQAYLIEKQAFVRKRAVRGRSVMGACGQLGNRSRLMEPAAIHG